jgi:hypothetical protein
MKRKYFLLIFTLLTGVLSYARTEIARICNPNGFTNIHSEKRQDAPVTGKIFAGEFFEARLVGEEEWCYVTLFRLEKGIEVSGFVRHSEIQLIKDLNDSLKKIIFQTIFFRQKNLSDSLTTCIRNNDTVTGGIAKNSYVAYVNEKYFPALELFTDYVCSTKDTVTFEAFLSVLWMDQNIHDRTPLIKLLDCFSCQPDLILKEVKKIPDKMERAYFYEGIRVELDDRLKNVEINSTYKKDYNNLKKKLDTAMK